MARKKTTSRKLYGKPKGPYRQKSVKQRIKALFLDNLGKVLTREQIIQAATDPGSGRQPENWHQRLSELRTDDGYTILSWRNRGDLKVQEYLMPHERKRRSARKRVRPTDATWVAILERAGYACEWNEAGMVCGLKERENDPVGGGRVKLTPDHKNPHSLNPDADPKDPEQWQALCGRHQVTKKNYWDTTTGKLNTYAIVQFAPEPEKREVFRFLLSFFGYIMLEDGGIRKGET
ncbi:restriction endonuclease [bacterium]|nr:MAG: restriction endonuclease [bacterium]